MSAIALQDNGGDDICYRDLLTKIGGSALCTAIWGMLVYAATQACDGCRMIHTSMSVKGALTETQDSLAMAAALRGFHYVALVCPTPVRGAGLQSMHCHKATGLSQSATYCR